MPVRWPLPRAVLRRTSSLRVKGAVATALPAVAIVVVLVSLVVVEQHGMQHDAVVDRAIAIDQAGLRLLFAAEQGASVDLPKALAALEDLLAQQPGRQPVGDLRRLVEAEQADLAAHRPVSALRVAAIRARVETLQEEQRRLQEAEDASTDRSLAAVNRLALLLAVFGLVGGVGGSALLLSRLVGRIRQVERNAELLARGEPLVAGGRAGTDEVASLAAALDRAAELIRDQRRRLQLALEVGRINVWEVDPSGRMTMQGDRADEYGTTMEQGLSTLLPEHAQQVRAGVEGVRADGLPRDYEVQNATDGRWFAGRLIPSSDTDVIAVSVDVTALRQAQDDLRASEVRRGLDALAASERRGRYNALVIGAAGEGIAAIDPRGVCTSANPAAARMLGYEVADLVGRDLHALVHHSRGDGSVYPSVQCPIRRAAIQGNPVRVEDDVFWRRDGTRLPVAYSVSPLRDDGNLRGVVLTFSDASDRRRTDEELERTAAALRHGVSSGAMRLHYQPKVNLRSGSCNAVEALVRWQRGDVLVFPDEFIGVAEQCGVIEQLTGWVIDEAARQAAAWQAEGLRLRVAVNLSALSLTDDRMVRALTDAAAAHRIPVSQLAIEITESAAAENPETVVAVLAELAAKNVQTAIDDFGTGFSSLSYLKQLPVGALKIDKSFVMNMPNDPRDQAIVSSTIHMAHSLGMRVIAEGVENELVLRMLQSADCDVGQGYHWSRPLPAESLTTWLRSREA